MEPSPRLFSISPGLERNWGSAPGRFSNRSPGSTKRGASRPKRNSIASTNGLTTALITRNSRLSAQTVFRLHQLSMDVIITREDGPFKPSPIPLELACSRLNVKHDEVWMVGDGQHDIEAANAAGIRSVWISHGKPRTFDAEPWLTVAGLPELTMILKQSKSS
jgi:phosphoglycolate phosphatase-like HAD superfamily hydrolase